ncbi:translesion DNA synthesis-associated protein ImuA [Castellaniella sp.]|uniref:translesion DNA synthesis-associated protein ImuA n=1 Tax=Castellaniella sp. TaxID=1955812 RepID=UPI00356737ED
MNQAAFSFSAAPAPRPATVAGAMQSVSAIQGVWRGTEISRAPAAVVPTGWAQLDCELPGGGWPCQSLVEVLAAQPAILEWRLLGPALRQRAAQGGQVVVVGPPHQPGLPGLQQIGLETRRFVWVQAQTPAERLWVTEQLIRANACGAIIAWLPQARPEHIRRLQVCAQSNQGLVFLCRPACCPIGCFSCTFSSAVAPRSTSRLPCRPYPAPWPRSSHPACCIPASRFPARYLSMLWAALSLPCTPGATPPPNEALHALAIWALQFTPRVAIADEAVVLEAEASTRLFGGRRALHERIAAEGREMGMAALAWAPNSLAALACVRAGVLNGVRQPLQQVLDPLPMDVLTAVRPHRLTLAQLGCHTLGDVHGLPRGGLNRRFGRVLLDALDQAYGLRPEVHHWVELPDTFHARLELVTRVDAAPVLLFGARRLLVQLCGWLAARHAGIAAFTLHWAHDVARAHQAGEAGELTIRTAQPMREVEHLCRLLAEHLARVRLQAPVGELALEALEVVPLPAHSASLLPDGQAAGGSLARVLERIAARLGPGRVWQPVLCEDHRLEWMQHWQPAPQPVPGPQAAPPRIPQPGFILSEPLQLAVHGNRPIYQGPLRLLAGPHRIEGGWWHRVDEATNHHVERDYWVAFSQYAGVLWIYQVRLAGDATAWYLHGIFA